MSRYIDADALKEWIDEYVSVFKKSDNKDIKGYIEHQPTIEPKRGEWVDTHKKYCGSTVYACSECKSEVDEIPTFYEKPVYKWCPYCGAMMKGADDDKA